MENTTDIRRTWEDQYFFKQEQTRLEQVRRRSAQEAKTIRLMQTFGIRDQELVRELSDAGFDIHTFRVLYLVPLIQVAWSDGGVSPSERDKVLEIAGLHRIKAGSAAHERLRAWLSERPSHRFFETCLRGNFRLNGEGDLELAELGESCRDAILEKGVPLSARGHNHRGSDAIRRH